MQKAKSKKAKVFGELLCTYLKAHKCTNNPLAHGIKRQGFQSFWTKTKTIPRWDHLIDDKEVQHSHQWQQKIGTTFKWYFFSLWIWIEIGKHWLFLNPIKIKFASKDHIFIPMTSPFFYLWIGCSEQADFEQQNTPAHINTFNKRHLLWV